LATAAAKTKNMQFVTGVTAAVYRYNPAIIAQAFASLDVLYPGRIGLGIGTGEAMNEVPVGFDWPSSDIRLARTIEAIQIIRKLWEGSKKVKGNTNNRNGNGFVNFGGQFFNIKGAKLYTPPLSEKIPLYMAASGKEAIQSAARYADGLITTVKPAKSKETFDTFAKAAIGEGKNPDLLEKIAKPKISYSEDYDNVFRSTEFWRASLIEDVFDLNVSDPRELERKAKREVSDEKLKHSTLIVTSIEECIKLIEDHFKAGFTRVYVHSTSPDEIEFIQQFCAKVLPYFNPATRDK
jgi:coenzyme F420-dependent glucose-6-phosphate dehydrogenase